jgi:uncharacterized membrane protein
LQLTRTLQHTSIRLMFLNLLFLFCVSLLPATTAFLGDHPTLPQAVTLWIVVSGSVIAVGHYSTTAAVRLGSVVPRWVTRRNHVIYGVIVLAVVGTQLSVYVGWALAFLATSLAWIPGQLGARVFGSTRDADAVIQRDELASGPGELSEGRTETGNAAPVSGPDS